MLEVEVKIAIGSASEALDRLLELGAAIEHPREFEENILLDVGGGKLSSKGALLRVRRYGASGTLTYKEPAAGPAGFKVRRELEAEIPDPEAILRILEASGFTRIWTYEKFRTVLGAGDVEILLDETPIGNFLELEGRADAIAEFVGRLGKRPEDCITASYRELMERWCCERGLPVADLLFARGETR